MSFARTFVASLCLVAAVSCSSAPMLPPPPASRFGAPVPVEPRDVRSIATQPCATLLGTSEWERLGFTPNGSPRTVATGEQSCRWVGPRDERYVSVIVLAERDPLVVSYRVRRFAIFQPTTVSELPATREQSSSESISCTITVSTAEEQGFVATYEDRSSEADRAPGGPCARGQEIAERIVASLPPFPAK